MEVPNDSLGANLNETFLMKYYVTQILNLINSDEKSNVDERSDVLNKSKTNGTRKKPRLITVKLPENAKELLLVVVTDDGECILPEWEPSEDSVRSETSTRNLRYIHKQDDEHRYTLLTTSGSDFKKQLKNKKKKLEKSDSHDSNDSPVLILNMCPEERRSSLDGTDDELFCETSELKDDAISVEENEDEEMLQFDRDSEEFLSRCTNFESEDISAVKPEMLLCTKCNISFVNKTVLARHSCPKSQPNRFICRECSEEFSDKKVFLEHLIVHSNKFACDKCEKRFPTSKLLTDHQADTFHGYKNACEVCEEAFRKQQEYKEHKKMHDPNLICEVCNEHNTNLEVYQQHIKNHESNSFHSHTSSVFEDNQLDNLEHDYSMKLSFSAEAPKFVCAECNREFVNMFALEAHKKIHKSETLNSKEFSFKLKSIPETPLNPEPCPSVEILCKSEITCGSEKTDNPETLCNPSSACIDNQQSKAENSPSTYICDRCGREYARLRSLQNHMIIHTGDRSFSCRICHFKFFTKEYLRRHMRIHSEKKFLCDVCPMKFTDRQHLQRHLKSHEKNVFHRRAYDSWKYHCSCCAEKFNSPARLMQHYETFHPLSYYKCVDCDINESSFKDLQKHFRNVHRGCVVNCCRICGDSFTDKNEFLSHRWTHKVKKIQSKELAVNNGKWCSVCKNSFPTQILFEQHFDLKSECKMQEERMKETNNICSECKKDFSCEQFLKLHSYIHNSNPPFTCDLCNQSFDTVNNFEIHILFHQNGNVQLDNKEENKIQEKPVEISNEAVFPHMCNICGKGLRSKTALQTHIYIHTGEKPFQCNECGDCFNQVSALNKHLLVHKGLKSYRCSECWKPFWVKTALMLHLQRHTKSKSELSHTCSVCSRMFNNLSNLTNHMRTHKGEKGLLKKKFACNQCKRTFTTRAHQIIHQLSHKKGSELICPECGKKFTSLSWLQYHMRIHTGESPHCSTCGKNFTSRQSLEEHLLSHKGESGKLSCAVCSSQFSSKRAYMTHMKLSHSEIVPAVCRKCGLGFTSKEKTEEHFNSCKNERGDHSSLIPFQNSEVKSNPGEHFNSCKNESDHSSLIPLQNSEVKSNLGDELQKQNEANNTASIQSSETNILTSISEVILQDNIDSNATDIADEVALVSSDKVLIETQDTINVQNMEGAVPFEQILIEEPVITDFILDENQETICFQIVLNPTS